MAALLMTGSSALAQENRGTEEQRVACTPDVLRLCSWGIPNVDRIVACLRREKSQLSAGCRQVLKIEATASRAALGLFSTADHQPPDIVAHASTLVAMGLCLACKFAFRRRSGRRVRL